jgi:hypothetical protein
MAQNQNGIRHEDFSRYRQFCVRRLRRLRTAKSIRFTYGKGKKFVQRELTPEVVTDPKHLMIALFNAERAWALGMELQREEAGATAEGAAEEGAGHAARRHAHMRSRLAKACRWADDLERLCAARGDARTSLEAEAYAAWMRGSFAMLKGDWVGALTALSRARAIYGELAKVAVRRLAELFLARADEIQPNERYCKHMLARKQGKKAAAAAAAGAGDGASAAAAAAAAAGDLRSKLDAALAQQKAARGDGVSAIVWRGTLIPVPHDKLRLSLGSAQEKSLTLRELDDAAAAGRGGGSGSGAASSSSSAPSAGAGADAQSSSGPSAENIYVDLLSRYDDISRVAAAESIKASKEGRESLAADFAGVEEYARFLRARLTLDRGLNNAAGAIRAFHEAEARASSSSSSSSSSASASSSSAAAAPAKGTKGAAGGKGAPVADSAAAAAPSAAPGRRSAWAESPLHQAFARSAKGISASASTSSSSPSGGDAAGSKGGSNALVTAANYVTSWYARLAKIVDEMIVLAGAATSPAAAAAAAASAGGAGTGTRASSSLPVDTDLIACLTARKNHLLASRAWYVALAYLHARRFADAAALLGRAKERVKAASDAFATLPGGPAALPARALSPGMDEAASTSVSDAAVLSGVCAEHAAALEALQDAIATRSVSIAATGLLEQLAPATRADADVTSLYIGGLLPLGKGVAEDAGIDPLPTRLVRSSRRQWLVERAGPFATLEPTGDGDATALGPMPPLPLPMPLKPILFDLAFNSIAYPEAVEAAAATAAAPTARGAAPPAAPAGSPAAGGGGGGGGGVLSWLTGR